MSSTRGHPTTIGPHDVQPSESTHATVAWPHAVPTLSPMAHPPVEYATPPPTYMPSLPHTYGPVTVTAYVPALAEAHQRCYTWRCWQIWVVTSFITHPVRLFIPVLAAVPESK